MIARSDFAGDLHNKNPTLLFFLKPALYQKNNFIAVDFVKLHPMIING